MNSNPSYSIVVPVYNEEKTITQSLDKIINYITTHTQVNFELIIVDDGSQDSSLQLIRQKLADVTSFKVQVFHNQQNTGKGYSVKRGMLQASGDYVLFTDADLSTPIEEIDKLKEYLDEYDVIIGSRNLKESQVLVPQPAMRRLSGFVFRQIRRLLIFPRLMPIKDTQCGFKCFKKPVVADLFGKQKLNGYTFDVEILYLASKFGYKILELPIVWVNNLDSKVKLLQSSWDMVFNLLVIRLNDWRGDYSK